MKLFQNLVPIFEFPIKWLSSLSKAYIESYKVGNNGSRLYNAKIGWRIKNHFSRKVTERLKLFKSLLPEFESPIKWFWSLSNTSIKYYKVGNNPSRLLKCRNSLTNKKTFFCETEANVETLPRYSPYIWDYYKMVLKSLKELSRIL